MKQELICERSGERCDSFLARVLPELSRSAAQRLLAAGHVTRAGEPLDKKEKLCAGDCLCVDLPPVEETELAAQDIPLAVVYEDGDVIVIDKPAGLVVHPAPGHAEGTLVNALLHHCGDSLSGVGGARRPGIVHRIDKDTSGLLIVAKNDFAHRALALQLQDHSLYRGYEAVVVGHLPQPAGTVSAPIGRHTRERVRMAVRPDGRPAVTHWQLLEDFPGYSHIACRLETGRTHQIRVHLSHLGHPVLGDPLYGGQRRGFPMLAGQCLHAKTLVFCHPRTGKELSLSCPLPESFESVLTKLRNLR